MIHSNNKEKFYFEIDKNQFNNLFYFNLKDEVGYCLVSDYYTQKTNCLKGINSVIRNSKNEDRFEVKEFSNGEFNVYLRDENGKIIRLLKKRKNLLIFCSLIEEAKSVTERIPGSALLTGATKKEERERILSLFKKGEITCVVNVGVLTTGFDYPGLEVVLIARSTLSLALYYQMIGRAMRIAPNKDNAWIVDLGGNIEYFGKIETMKINQTDKGYYYISNNGRSLTNVKFQR